MSKRRKIKSKVNLQQAIVSMLILLCVGIVGYFNANGEENYSNISEENTMQKVSSQSVTMQDTSFDITKIPAYTNQPYVVIVDGMLPFENQVAEYIEDTNHHVLYFPEELKSEVVEGTMLKYAGGSYHVWEKN